MNSRFVFSEGINIWNYNKNNQMLDRSSTANIGTVIKETKVELNNKFDRINTSVYADKIESIEANLNYKKINRSVEIENFRNISKRDIIEDGMIIESEKYLYYFVSKLDNKSEYLNGFFQEALTNFLKEKDYDAILSILHIMSNCEELEIKNADSNMYILLSLFSNKHDLLKEAAIKIFENWGLKKYSEILEEFEIKVKWIDDYRIEVIKYLKTEGI
ncbi:hypothetical protein OQE61_07450 [Cetobacterium somerae]|uniref:hypothetical protein n=1 Tax=Cetobacterium somerae TaxID=188913 RepID=UPI00225327E0|nr:hypothetical protein [Cetobacterium somerae]MCX3067327.1 hypothetical protein [Cetobacterium somerae]